MKSEMATDRLRELEDEHHTLDEELKVLSRRAYLTPGEQTQAIEIKKKKLSKKDAIYELRKEIDER